MASSQRGNVSVFLDALHTPSRRITMALATQEVQVEEPTRKSSRHERASRNLAGI